MNEEENTENNIKDENLSMVPKNIVPKNIVPKNIVPKNIVPKNIVPKNIVPKNIGVVVDKGKGNGSSEKMISMDIAFDEVIYVGTIVELKGTGFIKLDKEKFRMISLGRNEDPEDVRKLGSKRWGVIIPKGREKEFIKSLGNKWLLPDELDDLE